MTALVCASSSPGRTLRMAFASSLLEICGGHRSIGEPRETRIVERGLPQLPALKPTPSMTVTLNVEAVMILGHENFYEAGLRPLRVHVSSFIIHCSKY